MAEGLLPSDARDRAIRKFGGVLKARERFYESRRPVVSSAPSIAACSVPALRALRVDPAVALRCE